jgi:hypothetical protein
MGISCGTQGRQQKCIQHFVGKSAGKKLLGRTTWKDKIKRDVKKEDGREETGVMWRRTGTSGGLL